VQVIGITNLLPNLCDVELATTSYAADTVHRLAIPRRLIVELGNGSSSSSRSVPAFSSSSVPDQISEVVNPVFSIQLYR